MRRTGTWATLIGAVLIGVLAGVMLFARVGPLPISTAQPSGPSSPDSAGPSRPGPSSPPPSSADPSDSPSSPSTPAVSSPPASPSPSDTPSGSTPSEPPFTAKALLQPSEFEEFGTWGRTTTVRTWDGVPPDQVTSCTEPDDGEGRQVAAHAAVYRGKSTTAVEIVIRYADEETAKAAVIRMLDRVDACADQPAGDPDLTAEMIQAPDPDELSASYLWDTTGADGSTAQGAIGIVRAGDRVALLTLISLTSDPVGTTKEKGTTDLGPLLVQAGRRLV